MIKKSSVLGWENNFIEYVLDPIYGQIGLTEIEYKLINSKIFSRLRNIKQLGFVHNIYPSATHTRFEHSIGTLYITWNMLKRMISLLEKENKKEILELITDEVIQSIRLSALLHDIGHGPFSHSIEGALENIGFNFDHDLLSSILLTFRLSKKSQNSIASDNYINNLPAIVKESRQELSRILNPRYRELILFIFNLDFNYSYEFDKLEIIRLFLHDLLKGDIGSDRIDYLLRDTYFTGLGHKFSFSEVLENIYYIYNENEKKLLFSIKYEGKESVELLLLTRYFHYEFIANNILNQKYEAELYLSLKKYIENKGITIDNKKQFNKLVNEISLSNDWVEKEMPINNDLILVHNTNLLEFNNFVNRFFFYRVIEDKKTKILLKNKIIEFLSDNVGYDLKDKIIILFNCGKPRIPIMHNYLKNYIVGKRKISTLLHDNSPFLIGLGKAYVENSGMNIYVKKEYAMDVKKSIFENPDFYKSKRFLKVIYESLNNSNLNMHDYLLFVLFRLCSSSDNKNIYGFSKIVKEYSTLKKYTDASFMFDENCYCYDHTTKKSFEYPSNIYNSLILFDVCKFATFELMYPFSEKIGGEEVYRPSYEITIRKHKWISRWASYYWPLEIAKREYSLDIQKYLLPEEYEEDDEVGSVVKTTDRID